MHQIERQLFRDSKQGSNNQLSQRAYAFLEEIKQQECKKSTEHYSEGGSDSEAASDDLGEKEITSLHQQIIISLKEFKDKFYKRNKEEETTFRARNFLRSSQQIPKRGIEMIASLRKKAQNLASLKVEEGDVLHSGRQLSRQQQWLKSRTQSIKKQQYRPEAQSFQVYVNKVKFMNKAEENGIENKVTYFSPKKKRELSGINPD